MRDVLAVTALPATPARSLAHIRALEAFAIQQPQVEISTHHVLHAGLYARTITIPAGTVLTGALIEVATLLILNGDCTVSFGVSESRRLSGYNVLPADAKRKQAFIAHDDTQLTMVFATGAEDVEAAEDEFTAEAERLMSRQPGHANTIIVTGR